MFHVFDGARELTIFSVFLRLLLAMLFGGAIGLERARKGRAAGLRTYMLVCLGAALTLLLGQYYVHMLANIWQPANNASADITRFGAQVINGIGFLGAGTILVTGKKEIKGLTTAAGLWASACVGLAIGAGFYECVIISFILILLVIRVLPYIESVMMERARNINIYTEFNSLDNIGEIISAFKHLGVHINEVDINRGYSDGVQLPGATFYIRLDKKQPHTGILAKISELDCITHIEVL